MLAAPWLRQAGEVWCCQRQQKKGGVLLHKEGDMVEIINKRGNVPTLAVPNTQPHGVAGSKEPEFRPEYKKERRW